MINHRAGTPTGGDGLPSEHEHPADEDVGAHVPRPLVMHLRCRVGNASALGEQRARLELGAVTRAADVSWGFASGPHSELEIRSALRKGHVMRSSMIYYKYPY